MVKVFELSMNDYWYDDDGALLLYKDIDHAKSVMRKEGFTEDFIENQVEYHSHYNPDTSGYDLR